MPIVMTSAFGKRLHEKIERLRGNPIRESRGCDLALRDHRGGGEVHRRASKVRVFPRHEHGQQAGRPTHVTDRVIPGEIELLGQGLKITSRNPAHRIHELLEPLGFAIELSEHGRARVFDLVLWAAGPESVGEIAPESVQAGVGHFQEAAHELWALPIEEQRGFRCIAIAGLRAVAVAVEKAQCDQRVEEIRIGSLMQLKRTLQFAASHGLGAKCGEQPQLYRREQDLGWPEGHAYLHDSSRGERVHG